MLSTSFLNSSNFWFNYVAGFGFAVSCIWGAVTFVHRRWIRQVTDIVKKEVAKDVDNNISEKVAEEIEHIYKETSHNGGSSMKDALKRLESNTTEGFEKIEKRQEQLELYLQKLDKVMERHLGYHEGIED